MIKPSILIIDDSPEDCVTLRRYLSGTNEEHFRVYETHTGAAAIELMKMMTPDCILLDYYLPDMDGISVVQKLKNGDDHPRYPVIMLTASGQPSNAVLAMKQGIQDYLTKDSITPEILIRAINSAIERHVLLQQVEAQRLELMRKNEQLDALNTTLSESTRFLAQITDVTPGVMHVFDIQERRNIFINRPVASLLGYNPAEVQAMGTEVIPGLMHPEDIIRFEEHLSKLRSIGQNEVIEVEYRMRDVTGNWHWLLSRDTVFSRDPDGSVRHLIGSAIDITDRKNTEESRRITNQRFELAIANSSIVVFSQDLDLRYTWINNPALGETAESVLGKLDSELLEKAEDAAALEALKRNVLNTGVGARQEVIVRDKGVDCYYDLQVDPQLDRHGKIIGITCAAVDITDRKQAEQAILESENRFRLLADAAPVMIWTAGTDGNCHYLNKRWLDFTGSTIEENLDYGWSNFVLPEDYDRCLNTYLTAYSERNPFQCEFRLRRHDGQYKWILDTATPRFSPDGTFQGFVGCGIDITEQRNLKEQKFETDKLDSMGRLAGGIAHDFNTLLTAILGYTELTMEMLPEQTDMRIYLNNVSSAAERAAELAQQLLMYARRQMVVFTILEMNSIIKNIEDKLRNIAGEPYNLLINYTEEECLVSAHDAQIEQMMMNLVMNAREAMPDGGTISIDISSITLEDIAASTLGLTSGSYIVCSVRDHGIGMSEEVCSHIFEPFYTTKEITKGKGLGLATSYGIARQAKGNIRVLSEPEKGSTFEIYLPKVQEAAPSSTIHHSELLADGIETILLVDDEPMVRDIAARTLRSQGFQILEAGNGVEALRIYSEWPGKIDLLVTDVIMPMMGGEELAQKLRAIEPALKIVYMSGYTANTLLQQGAFESHVNLISKPFTAAGLANFVRKTLHE